MFSLLNHVFSFTVSEVWWSFMIFYINCSSERLGIAS